MSSATDARRPSSIASSKSDSVNGGCGGTVPNVIAPNVRPRAVSGTTIPDSFPSSWIALRVLRVVRHRLRLGLHVRDELRLAGADRPLHRVRLDGRRILLAQAEHQLGLRRIEVARADAAEDAVLVEVDRHVAGERRHGEVGERAERALDGERLVQHLAAAPEEAQRAPRRLSSR